MNLYMRYTSLCMASLNKYIVCCVCVGVGGCGCGCGCGCVCVGVDAPPAYCQSCHQRLDRRLSLYQQDGARGTYVHCMVVSVAHMNQ